MLLQRKIKNKLLAKVLFPMACRTKAFFKHSL